VIELKKTIQDLKMEIETITKTQRETTLEIQTLRNKSGTIETSISNRIQEMEERIPGAEDSIENMDTTIKENAKCRDPNSKHPENPGHNEKTRPTDNRSR
jgi:predicted  nucleic acid-binding Zn-ribbon protein